MNDTPATTNPEPAPASAPPAPPAPAPTAAPPPAVVAAAAPTPAPPPAAVVAAAERARDAVERSGLVTAAERALRATGAGRGRMALGNIVRGQIAKPLRMLVYGIDGIGKSTFASGADKPVFIGTEDGTSTLTIARFPEPREWSDVLDALDALMYDEHEFHTLVIDTLDWLEPLCWGQVCRVAAQRSGKPVPSIEDIPYGRGYAAAVDEWRTLLGRLDRLRDQRKMQIVLLAHAWIKAFRNPEGDDFDRFEIKLHAKTASLLREWADCVLFATHEQYTHEQNGRSKGIATGARILHTQRTAAFDAKNRHGLPPTLPLDWHSLVDAVAKHEPAEPERLRQRIAAALDGVDEALGDRVRRAVAGAGADANLLARILNKLTAQLTIAKREAQQ